MKNLMREIDLNFRRFNLNWKSDLDKVYKSLEDNPEYILSYRRIVSLQAWRSNLMQQILIKESLNFFLEAQNDLLISHVMARLGSWRSALKALRSCIDNIYFSLYYKDHHIELELWLKGKHRLSFDEHYEYLKHHPKIEKSNLKYCGLDIIPAEYSALSRAVHGSAKSYRMTADQDSTLLWSPSVPNLGAWSTREKRVICAINMLLIAIFNEYLQGAKLLNLRQAISFAIPISMHNKIREIYNVSLIKY
jgi:hypothetical protein